MLLDGIIAITLGVTGILLGMDRQHNFMDYIGPTMVLAGSVYAFWVGLTYIGAIIGIIWLLKLLTRG
jgi:hypothetical protein